ncbi:hypothetical protein GCM10027089_01900 [Nocardia thraciensis]
MDSLVQRKSIGSASDSPATMVARKAVIVSTPMWMRRTAQSYPGQDRRRVRNADRRTVAGCFGAAAGGADRLP